MGHGEVEHSLGVGGALSPGATQDIIQKEGPDEFGGITALSAEVAECGAESKGPSLLGPPPPS